MSSFDIPQGDVSRLKVEAVRWWGGGSASGPLLEAYHNKWAITPCGEGA